ncbi:hypothetical protein ACO0R3_004139 [Hanseniaspora guilliermondii]
MSDETEKDIHGVPIRKRPVNIPLVEKINKTQDDDFIDNNNDRKDFENDMTNHDNISRTPDEHELMNELDKLFAKRELVDDTNYSSSSSDSSSTSQSQGSVPRKSSFKTLRRSPSISKYTNLNTNFKELQPSTSNDTLTLDEDGNDSTMEDMCISDQYMNVDEVDAIPMSLSPKMAYSPRHQQNDDVREDFEALVNIEDDNRLQFSNVEKDIAFQYTDDHDYNMPVENKRLKIELEKKAKSFDEIHTNDHLKDISYEKNIATSISKASLDWWYKEHQNFILEIEHWFCLTLGLDSSIVDCKINQNKLFSDMIWYVKDLDDVSKIANFDDLNDYNFNDIKICQRLLHYTLGSFIRTAVECNNSNDVQHFMNDEYQQFKFLEKRMLYNCQNILKDSNLLNKILCMVKQHMTLVRVENDKNITIYNELLKISLSILFILICACLQDMSHEYIDAFRNIFDDLDFMTFITDYIESWRFTYKPAMNMRLILVLFNKLIVFQFGTLKELQELQQIINKDASAGPTKMCRTFDVSQYEAIRQDLITRYPELSSEIEVIDEYKYDMSYSSVQFINVPRPKKDMFSNMIANGKNVGALFNNNVPNIQLTGMQPSKGDPSANKRMVNSTNINIPLIQPTINEKSVPPAMREKLDLLKSSLKNRDIKSMQLAYWKIRYYYYELGIEDNKIEINASNKSVSQEELDFDFDSQNQHFRRIHKYYAKNIKSLGSLTMISMNILENLSEYDDFITLYLCSSIIEVLMNLLKRFSLQNVMKAEYLKTIIFDYRGIEIFCDILNNGKADRYMSLFYHNEKWHFWRYLKEYCHEYKGGDDIVIPLAIEHCYDDIEQDYDSRYLNMEYGLLYCLQNVIDGRTQRLKFLPLNIGTLFKTQYKIYNLCIYEPLLELIRQLTPFKSKKWRAEHMELITGVYLHLQLPLIENDWVTGKDTNGEILDAVNIELSIRSLIKFYNLMIKEREDNLIR